MLNVLMSYGLPVFMMMPFVMLDAIPVVMAKHSGCQTCRRCAADGPDALVRAIILWVGVVAGFRPSVDDAKRIIFFLVSSSFFHCLRGLSVSSSSSFVANLVFWDWWIDLARDDMLMASWSVCGSDMFLRGFVGVDGVRVVVCRLSLHVATLVSVARELGILGRFLVSSVVRVNDQSVLRRCW